MLKVPLSLKEEFCRPAGNRTVSLLGKLLKHQGDGVKFIQAVVYSFLSLHFVVQTPTVQIIFLT